MSDHCGCSHGPRGSHSTRQPAFGGWFVFKMDFLRMAVATISIALVWLHVIQRGEQIFGLIALSFCAYPIAREAVEALSHKRMTMELSMAIALLAALAIGEVLTALVIVLFVLIAEDLERRTVEGGRRSIGRLLDNLPQTALVRSGDQFVETALATVKPGDLVLIKPGSRVVVDGTVLAGSSFIDESAITGESLAAEKLAGSLVYAGTINQSGALEVRTERVGADTTYGRVVHAVEDAEKTRASMQRLGDKLSGYLVIFAMTAALVTFLCTGRIRDTISVILVAGACGIAAGTPLAILGSIAFAARRGSIIKGGLYLERLADVDTVVFDKTGTLTLGAPHVVSVLPAPGESTAGVLQAAATAERVSEHPLAQAILKRSSELDLNLGTLNHFDYLPGRGIVCQSEAGRITVGNQALMQEQKVLGLPDEPAPRDLSEVMVACNQKFVGRIRVADRLRPEARQVVAELQRLGIRVTMLTGDAAPVARSVAAQLGIHEVASDLRPEEKCQYVRALAQKGRKVAVIGDGINDAPALMEASVGVAVGSGTDIALECADVVLISNNLLRLVDTLRIARRCRRVIYFNFVGTVLVDSIGMLCAAMGLLNPLVAALIHVGSELAFIANSARLFPIFGKRR